LSKALGGAEALVFISYFEGFGIPLIEAMRAGVPVITSNVTSLPEIGGDAALYCDPHNTIEIAEAMHRLATLPQLAESLKNAGIKRAKLFTWERSAASLWESFQRML